MPCFIAIRSADLFTGLPSTACLEGNVFSAGAIDLLRGSLYNNTR
jgi:hypothetical protein